MLFEEIFVKKILLVFLLGFCLCVAPGMATQTLPYSGIASYNHPFEFFFTTQRIGDIHVNASWTPKGSTRYDLSTWLYVQPTDLNWNCDVHEPLDGSGSGQTVGAYHCDFTNAPIGTYKVVFFPTNGKTAIAINVTAETD